MMCVSVGMTSLAQLIREVVVRPQGPRVVRRFSQDCNLEGKIYDVWHLLSLTNRIYSRSGLEREDDMSFNVLASTCEVPRIMQLVVMSDLQACTTPRERIHLDGQWEVRAGECREQYAVTAGALPERRPDSQMNPRQNVLRGPRVGIGKVVIFTSPLFLGHDTLVIPTSKEGPPPVGVATQVEDWFPALAEIRHHPDVRLGNIIVIRVGSPRKSSLIYLPITRVHGRDLEISLVATEAVVRIAKEAEACGVQRLAFLRPPAQHVQSWLEGASILRRLLPRGTRAALCPGSDGHDATWMPTEWRDSIIQGLISAPVTGFAT